LFSWKVHVPGTGFCPSEVCPRLIEIWPPLSRTITLEVMLTHDPSIRSSIMGFWLDTSPTAPGAIPSGPACAPIRRNQPA